MFRTHKEFQMLEDFRDKHNATTSLSSDVSKRIIKKRKQLILVRERLEKFICFRSALTYKKVFEIIKKRSINSSSKVLCKILGNFQAIGKEINSNVNLFMHSIYVFEFMLEYDDGESLITLSLLKLIGKQKRNDKEFKNSGETKKRFVSSMGSENALVKRLFSILIGIGNSCALIKLLFFHNVPLSLINKSNYPKVRLVTDNLPHC
uniref:Uncharacterized protein n=1 Tax=Glossina brevipalpis TaxID=37001 RepID=A0A1A9WD94_9MUSC